MHSKKVIHRDISPQNILVFENKTDFLWDEEKYIFKLADFGCCKVLEPEEEWAFSNVGKEKYKAPEQG